MPVAPLALSDAVALDLIHQINLQAASDLGGLAGTRVTRWSPHGRRTGP
jgi:hypothetical protein